MQLIYRSLLPLKFIFSCKTGIFNRSYVLRKPFYSIFNMIVFLFIYFQYFVSLAKFSLLFRLFRFAKHPSKQFFSQVGTEPLLPGYYQYFWEVNVSCSRTQHGDVSEDGTPRPLAPESDALPLGHSASYILVCDVFFHQFVFTVICFCKNILSENKMLFKLNRLIVI